MFRYNGPGYTCTMLAAGLAILAGLFACILLVVELHGFRTNPRAARADPDPRSGMV